MKSLLCLGLLGGQVVAARAALHSPRGRITGTLLGVALACGLGSGSFEPASAAEPDSSSREGSSVLRSFEAQSAAFNVPAMWEYSAPLIAPEARKSNPSHAQKDPTVVFHDGQWHVFMTVKLPQQSAIEYGLQFLFQGMWDKDKSSKRYGRFQWRIGLLKPVAAGAVAQ